MTCTTCSSVAGSSCTYGYSFVLSSQLFAYCLISRVTVCVSLGIGIFPTAGAWLLGGSSDDYDDEFDA